MLNTATTESCSQADTIQNESLSLFLGSFILNPASGDNFFSGGHGCFCHWLSLPLECIIPREGFSVLFYFDATILFSVLLIMMQCEYLPQLFLLAIIPFTQV